MFGRNPGGNDDDGQAPPSEMPKPMAPIPMPTIRTFKVLRRDIPESYESSDPLWETIVVNAHALAVADSDRTVFQTWRIDPVLGPQLQVSRILTGVVDAEDVTPAPVADEPSRIIH